MYNYEDLYHEHTNTEELERIDHFVNEVASFLEHSGLSASDPQYKNITRSLTEMLTECRNPENWLTPLAHGAYKEVYQLCDGWVIKFTEESNPNTDEVDLCIEAERAGLQDIFLPIFYQSLPYILPCGMLCEEDDDQFVYDEAQQTWVSNRDFVPGALCAIMIQPAWYDSQAQCGRRGDNIWTPEDLNEYPLFDQTNTPITQEEFHRGNGYGAASAEWLQAILDVYGKEYFLRYLDFAAEHELSDMHYENIGYIIRNGVYCPCCIDCFSC